MNNTIKYIFVALFAFLGVFRLYGVITHYNEHHEIDWWSLFFGIGFLVFAVVHYTKAREKP